MSTPDSATNPLNTEQLMRTLLLDTQRLAEELSLLDQVRSALARETELDVPLSDQGVVVGTLNVESSNRVLNETDLRLILALSEHVNVAITRARLFKEVRECEERFRLLSEATFEGIVLHSDQRILDANQNYARMFGYTSDVLIGMDVLDLVAPESRDLMRKHIREGYEKPYELVGYRKDGTTFPMEVAGKAVPYYGRIVRVSTASDLT